MPNEISFGFRRPSKDSIKVLTEDIQIDGISVNFESGDLDLNWSYQSTVRVIVGLEVDLKRILRETGLPATDPLADQTPAHIGASIVWHSSKTGQHDASPLQELFDGEQFISAEVPSTLIGGTLNIRITVVLIENPDHSGNDASPRHPGSRLWEQKLSINLEANNNQFPISALKFRDSNIKPDHAMWKLEVDRQLDRHANSAIRLLLNTAHPRVQNYRKNPESSDAKIFKQGMLTDVVTQLLIHTVLFDLEDLNPELLTDGTLGEVLYSLHTTVFEDQSLEETRLLFEQAPGEIFAKVQSIYNYNRK